jgi:hypothetical protein
MAGAAVQWFGVDQRPGDRFSSGEMNESGRKVGRRFVWVHRFHIDLHIGLELVGTGNLNYDRLLDHQRETTTPRSGPEVFPADARQSFVLRGATSRPAHFDAATGLQCPARGYPAGMRHVASFPRLLLLQFQVDGR